MPIRAVIQNRKNLFTILSILTIILSLLIVLIYFYQASQPAGIPAVTTEEGELATTQESQGGIFLQLLLIVGGLTLLGGFIGVVFWTYQKTRSEFKYKNF